MRSNGSFSPASARGFTLVEILIAIVIASILAAFAVPGTRTLIARATLQSHARGLAAAVELARSEAIARGSSVSVCAANAARTGCSGAWSNGWIVFADAPPLGSVGATDTIVRAFGAVSPPYGVAAPATSTLTFAGTGDFVGDGVAAMARWTFTHAAIDAALAGQAVCVNLGTGRLRLIAASQACGAS